MGRICSLPANAYQFDGDLFAKRLRKAVRGSGLTVQDVAAEIDCDRNSIYRMMLGRAHNHQKYVRGPSGRMLVKLSQLFDVSSDWLLGLTNKER